MSSDKECHVSKLRCQFPWERLPANEKSLTIKATIALDDRSEVK